MRILQVSNGYPYRAYGGVELHTYRLCNALRERGHDVSVFARDSDWQRPDGDVSDEEVEGVRVRRVVNDFKERDFRCYYESEPVEERFLATLDEWKPDVVHFQHLIALSANLPELARQRGFRVVATVHDYWYVCHRVMFQHLDGTSCGGPAQRSCMHCVLGEEAPESGPLRSVAERIRALGRTPAIHRPKSNWRRFEALRRALLSYEKIVTPANFVVEEFARQGMPFPLDRTHVVGLGVDKADETPSRPPSDLPIRAERPLRAGFVGHSLAHKGPHLLLEAMALLPDLPIRASFWGARWPDHPYDERFSKLLDSEPRARHFGRFPEGELGSALASFDVLVVPSTCIETFGIATREAFLAGIPVLTTDRGALIESVRDGVDGLMVPGDDPGAMAEALRKLVEDPDLLPFLARGAQEAAGGVKSVAQYTREIEELLYS